MGISYTPFTSSRKTPYGPIRSLHPAQDSLSDEEPSPSSSNIVPYRPANELEDKLPPLSLALPQQIISAQGPEDIIKAFIQKKESEIHSIHRSIAIFSCWAGIMGKPTPAVGEFLH